MERYPHCDWLKTSYSANKVTFRKYANGAMPPTIPNSQVNKLFEV